MTATEVRPTTRFRQVYSVQELLELPDRQYVVGIRKMSGVAYIGYLDHIPDHPVKGVWWTDVPGIKYIDIFESYERVYVLPINAADKV